MITYKENWDKYVSSGDNNDLVEIDPEKVKQGDILVVCGEGWDFEVKVI